MLRCPRSEHNEYVYLVPFVENGNKIFLKAVFPNREATQYYLTITEVKYTAGHLDL
jgi:hypothetical protein